MNLPKAIWTWCLIIFFLLFALDAFRVPVPGVLIGIVALAAAVFLFLDR